MCWNHAVVVRQTSMERRSQPVNTPMASLGLRALHFVQKPIHRAVRHVRSLYVFTC